MTVTTPLLFAGGVGHAWGFSPLASRLTSSIGGSNAADMSGFILTASVVGQAIGVAGFTGIYLGHASGNSGSALALTTGAVAATAILTAACARTLRRAAPAEALRPRATGLHADLISRSADRGLPQGRRLAPGSTEQRSQPTGAVRPSTDPAGHIRAGDSPHGD